MNELLKQAWQLNVEFSLMLLIILLLRYGVRRTTKNYNAYLLWLSIPLGLLAAIGVSFVSFSEPKSEVVRVVVQSYFIEPVQTISYWQYVTYIWCITSLVLLVRLITQHWQLSQRLQVIERDNDRELVSSHPIVLVDEENFSPSIYGLIKTKIYFPAPLLNELSDEQISLIIKHEEHHIKQKHLWLNLLWDVVACLIWFNPVIYIARQSFRHDQELFCDYLVLKESNNTAQEVYGLALLSTASAIGSISLMCSWKAFNQLEERIMNIKKTSSRTGKLMLIACGMSIVGTSLLYAAGVNESIKTQHKDVNVILGDDDTEQPIKIGTRVLLGADNRVRIIEDGIEREATEFEQEYWATHFEEANAEYQNNNDVIEEPYPQDERLSVFYKDEFGLKENEYYEINCIEFHDISSKYDECFIIQGEQKRKFTPEQMQAYKAIKDDLEVNL